MGKTVNIGGRIHNPEVGNVVAGANEILDDTKGKKQNVINSEVDTALAGLGSGKQDKLTFDQTPTENSTNPVTSGGVYAADQVLQQAIEAILLLIPSAASALNQLADKSFVNSSIATASATFRGTYNLVSDLHLSVSASHQDIATALASVVATADNNDYCFVQIPTSDTSSDIRVTERYKFNGTDWSYEYDLNNSGFTAQQWEAINSGITALLVTKLGALPTAAELATLLAGKQATLTFDSTPTPGSANPVTSGGLYDKFEAIIAKIPSDASANNKLVAENRLAAYVTAIIEALDASFDLTSADGHVTFRMTQTNGVIASVQILTSDIASASQVSTNTADIAALQALYNALQQSAPQIIEPTDTWPVANPSDTVIYRVIDRVNTPPQYYIDYMWNGTAMVLMAKYNNAIDDTPTEGSDNLVKSGGVKFVLDEINLYLGKEVDITDGIELKKGYIEKNGTMTYDSSWEYGVVLVKANQTITVDPQSIGAYPSLAIAQNGTVLIGDIVTVLTGKTYTAETDTWIVVSTGNHLNSAIISSSDNIYDNADAVPTEDSDNFVKSGGVYDAVNSRVSKSDVKTEVLGTNLANPSLITDRNINNYGDINDPATSGWKMISIPVEYGQIITFGHFECKRFANAAFYNGSTLIGSVIQYQDSDLAIGKTVTVPQGATVLHIDVKTADSSTSDYSEIMVNIGETLLPYEPFFKRVTEIDNKPVTHFNNEAVLDKFSEVNGKLNYNNQPIASESSLSAVVTDLPVGDGTGIQSGYAYIDSTDRTIKVKA